MKQHIVITLDTSPEGISDMNVEFPDTMKAFEAMHICHMAGDIIREQIMKRAQVRQNSNIIVPQFDMKRVR